MSLIAKEPYDLTPDAAKFVSEVNASWDDVEQRLAASDEQKLELDGADPLTLDLAKAEKSRAAWRKDRIDVIREMITTLRRLERWPSMRKGERARAFDRAYAQVRQVREDVAKRCRSIGFTDVDADAGFIGFHPDVAAAADLLMTIDNIRHHDFSLAPYQQKLDALEDEIRRLVGVPAAVA